jgi:outer membrane protein TolC
MILTFLIACFAVAQGQSLRYEDLPILVESNNLHVKAGNDFFLAAQRREGFWTRSLLPRFNIEGGYETFQRELFRNDTQPFAAAYAEFNLFNGGRDYLESEIRIKETQIGGAEKIQTLRDELLKAQNEYWQLVYLTEVLKQLETYSLRNQKNLDSAKRRISAGSATQSDQMEFEMTRRIIDQDLAKAKTQLRNSRHKLNVLIGREPMDELILAEPPAPDLKLASSELQLDSKSLSEVIIADANAQMATLRRAQELRWWTPKLDLYAGAKQMNMRESDEFSARDRQEFYGGVKVSFVIFDGGIGYSEARSQAARARGLESKAIQSYRELAVDFENSKAELKQLSELVSAASKDVEIAENFLNRILGEYSRGVRSSSEVLSASDRSFEFRKRHSEIKRDFQISKAKLFSLLTRSNP